MNLLLTGASGFLGGPLTKRLLDEGHSVRALARNEGKLIELKQKYPSIDIYIGDIGDPCVVRQAMQGIDGVYHLAASKHVGLAEKFCVECINTNVTGSLNVLEQAYKNGVKFVLGISTDKAAQVNGVYGASKLLMERAFLQYAELNPECKYRVVRYGNVLYSTGSVLCKWKDLIEEGKEVIITEPEATRFFWTVDQALDLVEDCMANAPDAKPWCPDMKSMSMGDLLDAMIDKYSNGKEIPVKQIGMQAGDNLHERIMEDGPASNEVERFTKEEIMELI